MSGVGCPIMLSPSTIKPQNQQMKARRTDGCTKQRSRIMRHFRTHLRLVAPISGGAGCRVAQVDHLLFDQATCDGVGVTSELWHRLADEGTCAVVYRPFSLQAANWTVPGLRTRPKVPTRHYHKPFTIAEA
eukprot:4848506-Amphidinium_carterae.2